MAEQLDRPFAVISDIHGNLDALQAVLADIDERQIKHIVCLGDVVGYGPQPAECLDLVMERCAACLMGNHDYGVLYEPYSFNVGAEAACFWTRSALAAEGDEARRNRRWAYLGAMKLRLVVTTDNERLSEIAFVHGSPRKPINEYVFPDDVYTNPAKIHSLFERFGKVCFVGHTHVPGVFFDTPDFYGPDELDGEYELSANYKSLINVGSVGQPRDRDSRASYGIVDDEKVTFVRVPYDIDAVVEKINAISELEDYLGTRLQEGR
ncbi:MAG: metallophosphoesterase [Planctomycetes bacterium]|nr:metallophosphoesterase [Planctomycetota bacterium]